MVENRNESHLVTSQDHEWLIVHATNISVEQLVNVGRLLGVIKD